jgi:putative transcriptional regulator
VVVFGGYAGWSPGQLDDEMKRKAWLVHPATPELIFDSQPETLWRRILREKGGMFRVLADSPEDPEAN